MQIIDLSKYRPFAKMGKTCENRDTQEESDLSQRQKQLIWWELGTLKKILNIFILCIIVLMLVAPVVSAKTAVEWFNEGDNLISEGSYEEALEAFERAIRLDPQLAEAWGNKGAALNALGRFEEALTAFDKAIEINPQLAEAWGNKGVVLYDLKRYEEVLTAFNNSIEINPQLAEAWYNKENALYGLGRGAEAKEAFEKAHELDPEIEIPPTTPAFEAIFAIAGLLAVAYLLRRRK